MHYVPDRATMLFTDGSPLGNHDISVKLHSWHILEAAHNEDHIHVHLSLRGWLRPYPSYPWGAHMETISISISHDDPFKLKLTWRPYPHTHVVGIASSFWDYVGWDDRERDDIDFIVSHEDPNHPIHTLLTWRPYPCTFVFEGMARTLSILSLSHEDHIHEQHEHHPLPRLQTHFLQAGCLALNVQTLIAGLARWGGV